MTLRRQLIVQIVALLVGMVLIAATALWGLNGLRQDFSIALESYEKLREVYEIGYHVAAARRMQAWGAPYGQLVRTEIELARQKLTRIGTSEGDRKAVAEALAVGRLDDALEKLQPIVQEVRARIVSAEEASRQKRLATMALVGAFSAVLVLGAGIVAMRQYRAILTPLASLGRATRTMAAGRFADRADESGPKELATLAADFNRMAGQLETLYKSLEDKVAAKSRQLVRSERLAGVGFLAAGVAHEINNPLGIIAGHAELWLSGHAQDPQRAAAEAPETMKLVAEEAFRCKRIIEKLLTLSRGSEQRSRIVLCDIAESVIAAMSGLKRFEGKTVELHCDDPESTAVLASEAEMKQVMLNLLINAADAVSPGGRVDVTLARREGWVELEVKDTGRGMSPATLSRLFEPFFSATPATQDRGLGLGLSIAHAIVTNHGGRIDAYSEGEGKGSRFVVQLPPV
jgi:signal transduction histidine kinase